MVCESLLEKNSHLLPRCRLQRTSDDRGNTLFVHIPQVGSTENHISEDQWMNLSSFNEMSSAIMFKNPMELTKKEMMFKYFVQCITLFHDLALGRNLTALSYLIRDHTFLALSFQEVFDVMKAEAIPKLIRAHYTSVMLRFFIDREPLHLKPRIYSTRKLALDQASILLMALIPLAFCLRSYTKIDFLLFSSTPLVHCSLLPDERICGVPQSDMRLTTLSAKTIHRT